MWFMDLANQLEHALVAHPDVEAISFTGETTTGSTSLKMRADTLKQYFDGTWREISDYRI